MKASTGGQYRNFVSSSVLFKAFFLEIIYLHFRNALLDDFFASWENIFLLILGISEIGKNICLKLRKKLNSKIEPK